VATSNGRLVGLSGTQRFAKRSFDLLVACGGLLLTGWLIFIAWVAASIDTRRSGFFTQSRIGRNGRPFKIIKLRTMRPVERFPDTSVTTDHDPRITRLGRLLRKTKIDELPQLFNVLSGDMSFVGPRPDVPGFADRLQGADRIVLTVRPGITSPASLHFRDEERILAEQEDPERYNAEVLYPAKVRMNVAYVTDYSFWSDIRIILETLFGSRSDAEAPAAVDRNAVDPDTTLER
jgi:lipopolysaccharide/colanic/teichoic acid biosynthesis glycosyltransferase